MSRTQYWKGIKLLAREARRLAKDPQEDVSDVAYDLVASDEWVIDPRFYFDVLKHSDNTDAVFDHGQSTFEADTWSDLLAPLVVAAMEADVMDTIEDLE